MLSVSLITLGDPGQLTGGYLYHRRMAEAASAHHARLRFVSFPALPFPLPAARAGVVLRRACSPADVVVLDSIAAAFLAPLLVLRRPAIPFLQPVVPSGMRSSRPPASVDKCGSNTTTNVRFTNNEFGRDYQYGVKSFQNASPVWSGNVWDDTGAAIA